MAKSAANIPLNKEQLFGVLSSSRDIIFITLGIVITIAALFMPLPTIFIDIFLSINLAFGLILLLTTIYLINPMELTSFPSILLVATTYRLALNVATTRLILSQGDAGNMVEQFGDFVAAGNEVVGFVIFLILIIIQFIVITKGATRISEVTARFTLDAMPGKQMAIDADLNSGMIDEAEARERRDDLRRETDFYGAMDGASKFVRGDAIAGVVITVINIIGGFVRGMLQENMGVAESMSKYTKLTIGDGLVSQIPAFFISISAAILVTRSAARSNMGVEIIGQMFKGSKAMATATFILAGLALTPLPTFPLMLMSLFSGMVTYYLYRDEKQKIETDKKQVEEKEKKASEGPEKVDSLLKVDQMTLEVGYGLIPLVDPSQGGDLLERISMLRRQTAADMGIVVPPIRILDNMQLEPNQYVVKIRNVRIAEGSIMGDRLLAMDSGMVSGKVEGIETKEPAFGLTAYWIDEKEKERAHAFGYTVVEPSAVIATHITEVVKDNASELITREETKHLLEKLKESSPAIVEEVIPDILSTADVQNVLKALLRERISIRDLETIMEVLGDYGRRTKDIDILCEYVRNALSRQICEQYCEDDRELYAVTLDPQLEDVLSNAVQQTEGGAYLSLDPQNVERIVRAVTNEVQQVVQQGHHPVVLCSPQVRLHLSRILRNAVPSVGVLSYNEIDSDIKVQSSGIVRLEE